MAKPPPLQPGDVPDVQPVSLSAVDRKWFFQFVDPKVADHPAFDLPNLIGCIRQASRFTGFTPRIMAAGYEGAIDRLRHEERTGIRDNEIWARLRYPCCLDHVSYPYLAPLAADPRVSASTLRHAVELRLEQTAAWPSWRTVQSSLGGSENGDNHGLRLARGRRQAGAARRQNRTTGIRSRRQGERWTADVRAAPTSRAPLPRRDTRPMAGLHSPEIRRQNCP